MPARMDSLEARLYAIRSGLPGYSSMVSRAISYVDRNIHRNISLSDVCDELLVSMSHFSKCFKRRQEQVFLLCHHVENGKCPYPVKEPQEQGQ